MSAVSSGLTSSSNGKKSSRSAMASGVDQNLCKHFSLEEEGCHEVDHLIMPQAYPALKSTNSKQQATTREPLLTPLASSPLSSYTYSNQPTTSISISSNGCLALKEHKGIHLRVGHQKEESLLTDEIELGDDGGSDSDELDLLPTLSPSTSSTAKLGGGKGWKRLRRIVGCCAGSYSSYWVPPSQNRCSLM